MGLAEAEFKLEFDVLERLGYERFKVVNQARIEFGVTASGGGAAPCGRFP